MFLKIGQYYIREEAIANVSVTTMGGDEGGQVKEVFVYYIGTNPADNRDHFSGEKAKALAAYLQQSSVDVLAVQDVKAKAWTKIKEQINLSPEAVSAEEFGRRLATSLADGTALPFSMMEDE